MKQNDNNLKADIFVNPILISSGQLDLATEELNLLKYSAGNSGMYN